MYRAATTGLVMLAAMIGCEGGNTMDAPKDRPSGSQEGVDASAELHVEVFYRERMMLPPTAELIVILEDGAKMDVAAEKIAEASMPVESGPPYRVTLSYQPAKLDPRGRFGVRARIENEGKLLFTSTQFNPAFGTHGEKDSAPTNPVSVLLTRVPRAPRAAPRSLTGTRWVIVKLRSEDAGVGAGGKPASVELSAEPSRISGFAGCNQLSGGYALDGDQLSFSKMAMTMRACPDGMELEREVAKVLEETRRFAIAGDVLHLFSGEGTKVAELRAE